MRVSRIKEPLTLLAMLMPMSNNSAVESLPARLVRPNVEHQVQVVSRKGAEALKNTAVMPLINPKDELRNNPGEMKKHLAYWISRYGTHQSRLDLERIGNRTVCLDVNSNLMSRFDELYKQVMIDRNPQIEKIINNSMKGSEYSGPYMFRRELLSTGKYDDYRDVIGQSTFLSGPETFSVIDDTSAYLYNYYSTNLIYACDKYANIRFGVFDDSIGENGGKIFQFFRDGYVGYRYKCDGTGHNVTLEGADLFRYKPEFELGLRLDEADIYNKLPKLSSIGL
jgi:hypothetical protein